MQELLNSIIKQRNNKKNQMKHFKKCYTVLLACVFTHLILEIMNEPMTIAQCGHSFEKKTIY